MRKADNEDALRVNVRLVHQEVQSAIGVRVHIGMNTGAAGILLGLFSFFLPHTPPSQAGKKVTIREILGLDALALLLRPSYLIFILCSFLICIPLAGYYGQARNFVEFVGFANPTLTMSYGQMSEVLFMLVMPLCFARLGVKWMIAAAMLAWPPSMDSCSCC